VKYASYDTADRVAVGDGYAYDTFGRTTTIPAGAAPTGGTGGGGAITLGYYDDDSARTITQNGQTSTYVLDPAGRRLSSTVAPTVGGTATSTLVRHYTDSGDNPGWVADTVSGAQTRYAESLGGDLSAQAVTFAGSTTTQLSLSNLHGDNIATATLRAGGNSVGIDAWSDYLEYGTPRDTYNAGVISGQARYGW
jgi:hypothetical protein